MPPLTLDDDTLGNKHQHYNKLVRDAINNKSYEIKPISGDDSDVDNLLKIDIASKTRNVNYIIETLKCNDMLYVSRAIKKSTWLITDPQYADIINPEYLHTELFPSMNTKAVNKLMLHIRLNLKAESRVETFYTYLKDRDESYKWLQNCSIPFVENVIQNTPSVPLSLLERLCKKSKNFLPYYTREGHGRVRREILLFLKSNTAEVLNILEDQEQNCRPSIGKSKTKFLMKTCPERILHNLEKYIDCIELSIFAKYIKREKIIAFLYKQVNNKNMVNIFNHYSVLKHFIKHIPKEERVQFVKKHFIDKTSKPPPQELETFYLEEEYSNMRCSMPDTYLWYEYLPFNEAFTDLKHQIRSENSPTERCAMLTVLIKCARHNPPNIKTLINFYYEKHINEAFKFKIQFVNNLLIQIPTHDLDIETWNVLDQIFHSMEVYTESDKKVELCLKSIILYKVLHNEKIPAIVEKKIPFDTFKETQHKLNQEQKEKIFTYLLNFVSKKITNQTIANESDFNEIVYQLRNALTLLINWKRNINNYPFITDKIQELIKIKKHNSWKTELSELYNMKKSWRKHMFEESLSLCLCEETCLNALKHKPQLLMRHDEDLESLRTNEAVSLQRLLAKIRVYWPDTLTQHWTEVYLRNLSNPIGQKGLIKGLFQLLPQKQLLDIANKHVPEDFKVNWGKTDEAEISIRKNIAQYLHVARPLIPLDVVLWYAKGDYLQYAVPSLNAVIHYLSKVESREHLSKLLEGAVSLQKFGLHLAFNKLQLKDLQSIFSQTWNTTNHSTIRSVLFKHTYTLICTVKNENVEKQLWELLSMFIDNLTAYETKEIYEKLGSVIDVPKSIKAQFYMKSYEFLISLPKKANCERYVNNLLLYASSVMVSLDEDFVVAKILSPAVIKLCTHRNEFTELFTCFVICGKTEEEQLQRFRKTLQTVMEDAFQRWDSVQDEEYYIRNNFDKFLHNLVWNFRKYVTLYSTNTTPIPVKLFIEIKTLMEEKMQLLDNYVMYTSWKLITEYIKLMGEHQLSFSVFESKKFSESDILNDWMPDEIENIWKKIHFEISPKLGPAIVRCLKEDTDKYFPTTCLLFVEALEKMINELSHVSYACVLDTLKYMLNDDDIPSYILVSYVIPKYVQEEQKIIRSELRRKIISHPSKEVRMHYYWTFRDIPEDP